MSSRSIMLSSQKISGHQGALRVWKMVSASAMAPEANSVTHSARASCVHVKPPRHKRAGHIEERDGKLYATHSAGAEQHATA